MSGDRPELGWGTLAGCGFRGEDGERPSFLAFAAFSGFPLKPLPLTPAGLIHQPSQVPRGDHQRVLAVDPPVHFRALHVVGESVLYSLVRVVLKLLKTYPLQVGHV
jgi:hypothetical protein